MNDNAVPPQYHNTWFEIWTPLLSGGNESDSSYLWSHQPWIVDAWSLSGWMGGMDGSIYRVTRLESSHCNSQKTFGNRWQTDNFSWYWEPILFKVKVIVAWFSDVWLAHWSFGPFSWGSLSTLSEVELEELHFILTGLGPKVAVRDLCCSSRGELTLDLPAYLIWALALS